MAETTVYLEVEPGWSTHRQDANGDPRLDRIKVSRVMQRRPARIAGVVVKLTLRIPDGAFMPLAPDVTIDVPASALSYEPIITVELPDSPNEHQENSP